MEIKKFHKVSNFMKKFTNESITIKDLYCNKNKKKLFSKNIAKKLRSVKDIIYIKR